ncbi:MAG TPA: sigma-54 dependent transcriptional regulator [Bryobacteraceae bacterium]
MADRGEPVIMTAVLGGQRALVGTSTRMRHVAQMIHKLGNCRWPALLLGETGTGKEVVARSIHGVVGQGPFVTIDCSALVGPLVESELFGHVKGAFTGAFANKTGLIEMANGGTAFFDEIGELPLDLQAKLLRVLQEKEFRPVGSLVTRKSDFRIVAATNRDLAKEVERGTFRRDLFFRLNVVTVRIPPLRERKEDIPLLIEYFLEKFGRGQKLAAEALEAVLAFDWPGNVRELENCVQHMVAINSGPMLHTADLPSAIQNHLAQRRFHMGHADTATNREAFESTDQLRAMAAAAGTPWSRVAMLPSAERRGFPGVTTVATGSDEPSSDDFHAIPILPLMEVERRAIMRTLEYARGDRSVAANLLGIGRTTLYRKLKEYRLAV